jgi:hypothetical protein
LRYVFICLAASAVAAAVWLFATHSISLWADRLYTVPMQSWMPDRFRYTTRILELGRGEWSRDGSGPQSIRLFTQATETEPSTTAATIDAGGRVSLVDSGKSFPLGAGQSNVARSGWPELEFTPDAGDTVQFSIERSLLSWPTPFETNFMTGVVPHWKRNAYCRLRWTKRSGARLEMLWRVEQSWYTEGGWVPPRIGYVTTGLLPVRIKQAADLEAAAVQYLASTRHWKRSEYQLEFRGPSSDGREEVVFVLHRDDLHSDSPGAGKSLELRLGYASRKVSHEIGGQ